MAGSFEVLFLFFSNQMNKIIGSSISIKEQLFWSRKRSCGQEQGGLGQIVQEAKKSNEVDKLRENKLPEKKILWRMKLDKGWRNESQIVPSPPKKCCIIYISFAGWTRLFKTRVLDKSDLKTIPGLSWESDAVFKLCTRGHRRGYRLSLRKPKKRKCMLISNWPEFARDKWYSDSVSDYFYFFGSGTGLDSKIRKAKKAASMLFVKNSTNCPVLAGEGGGKAALEQKRLVSKLCGKDSLFLPGAPPPRTSRPRPTLSSLANPGKKGSVPEPAERLPWSPIPVWMHDVRKAGARLSGAAS